MRHSVPRRGLLVRAIPLFLACVQFAAFPAKPLFAQAGEAPAPSGMLDEDRQRPAPEDQARRDALDRERARQTRAWRTMVTRFHAWLATQSLYDDAQTSRLQQRFLDATVDLSPAEMRGFVTDMNAKLDLLRSETARETAAHLAETLAVASPAYGHQMRERLPDVISLSPDELERQLAQWAAKRTVSVMVQQTFDQYRRQQAAESQALRQTRRENHQRNLHRTAAVTLASSNTPNPYTPSRSYFPSTSSQPTYILPFVGPWWWGGGVVLGSHHH